MWSLTSDHTHCFLKLGSIKPGKARLVTYNGGGVYRARARNMEYAATIAHIAAHTLRLLLVLAVLESIVSYSKS
jgi:hypothetical protein